MRYIALVLLAVGCIPPLVPTPKQVATLSDCELTCSKWRELECEEGKPTAKGATCEEVCVNAAESDIDLAKQPECIETSITCASARRCPE